MNSISVFGLQVNLSINEIHAMMEKKRNIRNISMIGFYRSGKHTLADYLVGRVGINLRKDGPTTSKPKPQMHRNMLVNEEKSKQIVQYMY